MWSYMYIPPVLLHTSYIMPTTCFAMYSRPFQEAKKKMEEEAQRRAGEEAKRIREEEALRRAGKEALRKAGEEALRRAEEETLQSSGEEIMRRSGDEAKGSGQSMMGRDRADRFSSNVMDVSVTKGMEKISLQGTTTTTTELTITSSSIPTDHVPDAQATGTAVQSVATNRIWQGVEGYETREASGGGMVEGLDPHPPARVVTTHDPSLHAPPPSYQKSEWPTPGGSGSSITASDSWASSFNAMTSGSVPTSVTSYISPWSKATAPPYDPEPRQNMALYQFPPSVATGDVLPPPYAPSLVGSAWGGPLPLPTGSYTPDVGGRPVSAPPASVGHPPMGGEVEGVVSHSSDRPATAVPAFDRSLKPASVTASLGGELGEGRWCEEEGRWV